MLPVACMSVFLCSRAYVSVPPPPPLGILQAGFRVRPLPPHFPFGAPDLPCNAFLWPHGSFQRGFLSMSIFHVLSFFPFFSFILPSLFSSKKIAETCCVNDSVPFLNGVCDYFAWLKSELRCRMKCKMRRFPF